MDCCYVGFYRYRALEPVLPALLYRTKRGIFGAAYFELVVLEDTHADVYTASHQRRDAIPGIHCSELLDEAHACVMGFTNSYLLHRA